MTDDVDQSEPQPDSPSTQAQSTDAVEVGSRLDDLLLVREIGAGGQGKVFEAKQETLDRAVAVKILARDLVNTEEQLGRFKREAEAAGRLQHPNIVGVFAIREWHGHPLIVQEFVQGVDLEHVIKEKRKDGGSAKPEYCHWAADICRQLALALQHAHDHNVIHRDIKPGNILMDRSGTPKIADFGLAKVEDKAGLSISGNIMGTPHYMSPEQVEADPAGLDHRTDIYSLGAMLYRMLTGRVPVKSKNLEGIFLDILHRPPVPPRNINATVDKDLEAVCLKALEKKPATRYQTAADFAADLERYLHHEATVARPVSVVGRTVRLLSRQATSTLAAVAVLVPTLWILVDVLVLQPLAGDDPGALVRVRLTVVAVASALLAWPLSLLGVRLARGRRWVLAPAIVLALAVGSLGAWRVLDQRLHRLHMQAREALSLQIVLSERNDVRDVEEYVADWETRFTDDDVFLVARSYLKRGRAGRAEEWVRRWQPESSNAALYSAVLAVIDQATGSAGVADSARLADTILPEGSPWSDWKRVGDAFQDMGLHGEARRAYETAGRLPDADRDLVNLSLAQVWVDLCEPEEAKDLLRGVLRWRPDDPEANRLAFSIATHEDDIPAAERYLSKFESSPRTPRSSAVRERYAFTAVILKDHESALRLKDEALAEFPDDNELLAWFASRVFHQGLNLVNAYDKVTMFEGARELFLQLRERDPDSVVPHNSLAGVYIRLSRYRETEERLALLENAIESASRAVELDPYYWQAHYNLGLARWYLAKDTHGGSAKAPLEDLETYIEHMRQATAANAMQAAALNNLAMGVVMHSQRTGETDRLAEGFDCALRSIRIRTPPKESACSLDREQRIGLCNTYDTLSLLHEQAGDLPAALDAFERAYAVLDDTDPEIEAWVYPKLLELRNRVQGL